MTECETPLANSINDDEQQLIKLCLKKPQKWNWELTTSKSSNNILFPTIQLFDENNISLLAEANEANFSAGSQLRKSASVSKASSVCRNRKTDSFSTVAKKSNFASIKSSITHSSSSSSRSASYRHDLNPPFNVDASAASPSKEEKRQQKIYSRSSSCRSRSSILKRIREFSELNHDSSDDDDCQVNKSSSTRASNDNKAAVASKESLRKKYSMRTCNVGTILVPKESFSRAPRRRRRGSYPNAIGE